MDRPYRKPQTDRQSVWIVQVISSLAPQPTHLHPRVKLFREQERNQYWELIVGSIRANWIAEVFDFKLSSWTDEEYVGDTLCISIFYLGVNTGIKRVDRSLRNVYVGMNKFVWIGIEKFSTTHIFLDLQKIEIHFTTETPAKQFSPFCHPFDHPPPPDHLNGTWTIKWWCSVVSRVEYSSTSLRSTADLHEHPNTPLRVTTRRRHHARHDRSVVVGGRRKRSRIRIPSFFWLESYLVMGTGVKCTLPFVDNQNFRFGIKKNILRMTTSESDKGRR